MVSCYCRISVACDTTKLENILLLPPLVWSTLLGLLGRCGIHMHPNLTSDIRRRRKRRIRIRWQLHVLRHGAIRGCGLTSLVACINNKFRDIRERNVTIRSEIWATSIHSLGFWDSREWMILWGLILWSLGCIRWMPMLPNGPLLTNLYKNDTCQ